jgi:hypothetical protein
LDVLKPVDTPKYSETSRIAFDDGCAENREILLDPLAGERDDGSHSAADSASEWSRFQKNVGDQLERIRRSNRKEKLSRMIDIRQTVGEKCEDIQTRFKKLELEKKGIELLSARKIANDLVQNHQDNKCQDDGKVESYERSVGGIRRIVARTLETLQKLAEFTTDNSNELHALVSCVGLGAWLVRYCIQPLFECLRDSRSAVATA